MIRSVNFVHRDPDLPRFLYQAGEAEVGWDTFAAGELAARSGIPPMVGRTDKQTLQTWNNSILNRFTTRVLKWSVLAHSYGGFL